MNIINKLREIMSEQEPEVHEPQAEVEESEAKKAFRAQIEAYKAQNPEKYALKEEELLNKLNSL